MAEVVVVRDIALIRVTADIECTTPNVLIRDTDVVLCGRYAIDVRVPRDVRRVILVVKTRVHLLDCLDGVCIGE